jgi:hypothetical protein
MAYPYQPCVVTRLNPSDGLCLFESKWHDDREHRDLGKNFLCLSKLIIRGPSAILTKFDEFDRALKLLALASFYESVFAFYHCWCGRFDRAR